MIYELIQSMLPYVKYTVPSVAIILAILYFWSSKWRAPYLRGGLIIVLLVAAVFSSFDWSKRGWLKNDFINSYEFFHYYLPAKYAQELGYTRLYGAAIIAEKELGHRFIPKWSRDLETGQHIRTKHIFKNKDKYKAYFSKKRWEEFKKDVHFFRLDFKSNKGWQKMMKDKGYNGTPVWTMIGGAFANNLSTDNKVNINILSFIDWIYFFSAMFCVAWAFGIRAALFLTCLLLTHYVAFHGTLKSAFMRLDWVMCLIMSTCFIKKKYYRTAGVLTAVAALSRVFPVIFIFGVLAHAVWRFIEERRIEKKYVRFFVSFFATCVVMLLASIIYTGVDYWKEFIIKITSHSNDVSAWRVGLKYIFLMSYDRPAPGELSFSQKIHEYGWVYTIIQLSLLSITFVLIRRISLWQAYTFGFIVSFVLVSPTYYYYIMLGVPFLFFIEKLEAPGYMLGVAYMFFISIIGHYWLGVFGRGYEMFFWYSVVIAGAIILIWFLAWREWLHSGIMSLNKDCDDENLTTKTSNQQ